MNFTCHIHPCQNARQRDAAMRVAQHVGKARAHDADDLVDDILFILDKAGLDEARMSAADDVRQVSIEGRLWLSWFPSELAGNTRVPCDDADGEYTVAAAAMRFGYNEKTLRIYVQKGWLRAGTNTRGCMVITDSAMREYEAARCTANGSTKHLMAERYRTRGYGALRVERKRSLLDRLRKRRVQKVKRASCMTSSRAVGAERSSVRFQGTSFPAISLRPARSVYPLRELVPLPLRRDLVLNTDRAVYPFSGNSGPPVLAIAHAPP